MKRISQLLFQGRTVIYCFVAYLFMAGVVMNYGSSTINSFAGKNLTPLDLHFSYSLEQTRTFLAELGITGRAFYACFEITADILYPIVYTLFFCSLLGYTWRETIFTKPHYSWLIALPLTTLIFDFLENISIFTMIMCYPLITNTAALVGSFFTSLKWVSAGVVIASITLGLVRMLIRKEPLLKEC